MKSHILMLGTSLDSHGGISQLQRNIIRNWPDCDYTLDHITTHVDGTCLTKIQTFIKSIPPFLGYIIKKKPQLIHIHFSINASIFRKSFYILFAKLLRIKVVLHAHTGELDEYISSLNMFARIFVKFSLSQADGLIVLSTSDIQKYQKYCTQSRVFFLRNPVCNQIYQSKLIGKKIITVGTLCEGKGSFDLLKAASQVCKDVPDAHFVFVGDGDLEKLKKEVENNRLVGKVTFTGWLNQITLQEIYLSASIFILPSYHEGMPMAILEAMSFGLPVISTDVNGIPDVVLDGVTGILIQPGQIANLSMAIKKLLSDKELRKKMGIAGKQRIENYFTPSVVTNDLISIYDEIIVGKRHGNK